MSSASQPQSPLQPKSDRLLSLDTLRGLDMFIIVGFEGILHSLMKHAESPSQQRFVKRFLQPIAEELTHPEWNGFTFYDLIFPLFMFLAGVSFSYSLNKRRERGVSIVTIHRQIIQRALILVLLGAIFNGALSFDFANTRFASVLGRIGLGYMGGALIACHATAWLSRLGWCIGILLAYWAALMLIPVPGFGAGDLTPGHTLVGYVDRMLLPGKLYKEVRDPEGLLSTLPSFVNVLAGVMTGDWLRRLDRTGYQKVVAMFATGAVLWCVGKVWDNWFPINKNLWSSSFVSLTVGWSLIFLAAFYLVIDVWKIRRWTFFFVVIGANPLLIYFAPHIIGFGAIAYFVLGGDNNTMHPFLIDNSGFVLKWLTLYYMYRRGIFWRV